MVLKLRFQLCSTHAALAAILAGRSGWKGGLRISAIRKVRRPVRINLVAGRALGEIKGRIKGVEVSAVEMLLHIPENLAETLEVDNLPFAQKADRISHIRVFDHAKNILIGTAGFLLCCNGKRATK